MKQVLFLDGCVRGNHSRSRTLAQAYLKTLAGKEEIQVNTLVLEDLGLGYLTGKDFDATTGELMTTQLDLATTFAQADYIVLAAPFWEFTFPAVVSCYLEAVSLVGTTFTYTEQGSVGLCQAKKWVYCFTAGDKLQPGDDIGALWLAKLAQLFGIPEFETYSAQGLDWYGADVARIVEDACQAMT